MALRRQTAPAWKPYEQATQGKEIICVLILNYFFYSFTGFILDMGSANGKRCYYVTPFSMTEPIPRMILVWPWIPRSPLLIVPQNPTLWRRVPQTAIRKSIGLSTQAVNQWKPNNSFKILCLSIPDNIIYSLWWRSHPSTHGKYEKSWLFLLPSGESCPISFGSAMSPK